MTRPLLAPVPARREVRVHVRVHVHARGKRGDFGEATPLLVRVARTRKRRVRRRGDFPRRPARRGAKHPIAGNLPTSLTKDATASLACAASAPSSLARAGCSLPRRLLLRDGFAQPRGPFRRRRGVGEES